MAQKFYMEATQHSDSVLRAGLADLQDGGSPSAKVRGGALQSSYIASFTIPAKPQFGGGELKEAEMDLYVTDVDYLAGSSRTPEFSIYKFKEASVINEGPNGFFTEAMYGYGKATGSNNQYSDVVRGGEKLDGRNNIIAYSSTLNGLATLDESFNGKGNSFSDGGEYIAAGRTLFQDALSYTTPKAIDDYAVRAWGESWLGSWAIARDENYSIAEIKDIYGYPAEELGLGAASEANITGMVIPVDDKALHSNSGHTKAVTPKDGKEGVTLYFDDDDWSKSIFSGNRNVIDAEAYGDEVTPSNSMFEIVTTAHAFFEDVEASGEGSTLKATGDIKYSTKTYLTGGQSAELFTYWDHETDLEGDSKSTIDYKKGWKTNQNRQEVMLAKKWIPYPMTHPAKTYRPTQDRHDFSNVIEMDLNIESLEYAYACGDGSAVPSGFNSARWMNLRRSIVVCFGEEEPKAGMTLYDYVNLHRSNDGTQTAVNVTNSGGITSDPIACNNYGATGAKNFAAFAIVNTNVGIKVIPSCTHPSIGSYKLGRHSATALTGHTPSNFIWHVDTVGKDVWIADDNYMNKSDIEDLTGNWIRMRVCISESGGPSIWLGDKNSYLHWGTETIDADDGEFHFIGSRPTFGSLLMTLGDKDEMIGQTEASPILSAVNSGGFGLSLNEAIPMNDFPLCNWKLAGDTTTSKVGQNINPTNYMKHMVIFVSNFKANKSGSNNLKIDHYLKEDRPTSTKVFIDSVKFKNFNYAINNASRGREWNKHPDSINIEPSSAIIGPEGRPSALVYKNPDAETFAATAIASDYLEYNNVGKLGAYRDVAPTILSFGFESVTGRYHWRWNALNNSEDDIDDMPWLRPYTPMMYFSGFSSPNLGNMAEIPTGNMLFTYTSAGDKASEGDIIFGNNHAGKTTLMGLGLSYDANNGNAGAYTSNISTLPINDHGWIPIDRGSGSEGYPDMNFTSVPTIALKDFYTGFHLSAAVNASPTFILTSQVHGDGTEDSPEYFQQCLPIRAGDIVKTGDVYASQQNTLTVDTIAHTGTAYIQNNSAAHGLTMVTTGNATGSLAYDAVYTQPEGSIRNWSSKGFAQMSVMAGGTTSTDNGDQWTMRENGAASARITDIVSSEGKLILQVDTLKPLLLNPTDRFIVYIYRDSASPSDFGYLGDSIQPTGDPAAGGGCRNFRIRDIDGYTLNAAASTATINSSCKPNLIIESLDTSTNQITLIWDGYAADGTTKLIRYPNIPKLMISAYKQWIQGNVACENLETIHSETYTGIKINSSGTGTSDYIRRVGDDRVSSIAVGSGGSGYSSAPTVVFSAPETNNSLFFDPGAGTWCELAAATATVSGGAVTSIAVTTKGFGYTSKPTVTFTGGGGSGATVGANNITMDTADGVSFTNAIWNSRSMGLFGQGIKKGDRIVITDDTVTGAENSGVYSVERATANRLYFGKYHSGWLRRSSSSDGAVTITKLEPTQALSSRSYRSVSDLQSPFVVKKEQLTTPTEDNPVSVIQGGTGLSATTTTLVLTRSVISGSSPTWTSLVGQHIMIDDEIMFVKSLGSPDTTTVNVFRGQMRTNTYVDGISTYGEGTTHKQGAKVYLVDLHLGGSGEELTALDSSTAANSGDHTQRIINARNLGATYAASQLNFAPDAGGIYGAYLNRWKPYTLPDDEGSLQLKTDFGFGSYEQDKDDGGQVAKGVVKGLGYNEFKMEKLITGGGIKALDTVNFLVTYSDTGTPHEVTINTRDAEDDNPILFAIYEDALPIAPTLKVVPYEEDAQLPLFTWEASDSDLWYGILHVDKTNIYNQYHNRELHIPLNDGGIHKRVPSIVKVNDSVTNVTIGSSVRVDRGGLAEYALRFDGEDNFIFAGNVDPDGTTTLDSSSGSVFDAELDIGDRIIVGAVEADFEERTIVSVTDYNTLTVDTAFSDTADDSSPLRLNNNFITYGTGSTDPTPNCTSEMSIVVHITPDSDISGISSIVSQRRKFSIELDANKRVVASLYYSGSSAVILTSSTIVTADGITPTAIKVTFDKNIKSGNVKLFINGQLEDQSGLITASGSTNNWKNDTNVVTTNDKVYIGAPQTELQSSIKSNMDAFTFKGLIEELVIYKSCIYPIVPQDQKFIFTKYLTEIENGSAVSYQARLFIKDYHNIRGSTPDEVAVSAPVSWRKAAFRLVD